MCVSSVALELLVLSVHLIYSVVYCTLKYDRNIICVSFVKFLYHYFCYHHINIEYSHFI